MAGTITKTVSSVRYGVTKYSVAWTCTAGGAVSGNAFAVVAGALLQLKFVPGTGGNQPTDLYDITLVDTDGVDVIGGAGANLRNTTPLIVSALLGDSYFHDATQNLDLVVANAGNAKSGSVVFWVGDPRT